MTRHKNIHEWMNIPFIRINEFLSANKFYGKSLAFPDLQFQCYIVSNCICAGERYCMAGPISSTGKVLCFFEESDPYFDEPYDRKKIDFINASNQFTTEKFDEIAPLSPLGSQNFFHWMIQNLSKVIFFEKIGFTGTYIVKEKSDFIMQSFDMLGIDDSRIVLADKLFIAKRMFLADPILNEHIEVLKILRNKLLEYSGEKSGTKKSFLKRIGTRKIINETQLLDLLARYDFEVLVPETKSLQEQIAFISNSILTVSPHGANSILALFQKNDSFLMEFFSRTYTNHCVGKLAEVCNLFYIPITEARLSPNENIPINMETKPIDYHVDIDLVRITLDNIHRHIKV